MQRSNVPLRTLVTAILTAAATAGCLASPSALLSDAQVESTLARLRGDAGELGDWQARARVHMPGAEGSGRILAGGGGRFRLEVDGPIQYAEVHDGERTSKLFPWGTVLDLGGREEEMTLIPMWVMTGYWLSPQAPLSISAGESGRQGNLVTLEVRHRDGKMPFEVTVDMERGAPISVESAEGTPVSVFELDDHRIVGGRPIPGTMRVMKGGKAMVELVLDEPGPLASDEDTWRRPEAVAQASYDRDVSPELESLDDGRGYQFVRPVINGRQMGWFLFDTGAPATILGNAAVNRLELDEVAEARSSGVGGHAEIGLHAVRSIQVGPVRIGPVYAASMDVLRLGWRQLPIEGILGCDVIRGAVLEYEVRSGSIAFRDPATYELPAGASWQRLQLYEGKPISSLRFEGHEADVLLDTAAGGALSISKPLVDRLGLLKGRKTRDSRSRGVGGSVDKRRGTVRWLELGGRRFEDVTATFAVSDQGSHAQPFPDGLVGIELIGEFRLVLDLANRRIAFLESEKTWSRP